MTSETMKMSCMLSANQELVAKYLSVCNEVSQVIVCNFTLLLLEVSKSGTVVRLALTC